MNSLPLSDHNCPNQQIIVQDFSTTTVISKDCITSFTSMQYCTYRLEEAHIVFNFGVAEGFFGCNSPKPKQILIKPGK